MGVNCQTVLSSEITINGIVSRFTNSTSIDNIWLSETRTVPSSGKKRQPLISKSDV